MTKIERVKAQEKKKGRNNQKTVSATTGFSNSRAISFGFFEKLCLRADLSGSLEPFSTCFERFRSKFLRRLVELLFQRFPQQPLLFVYAVYRFTPVPSISHSRFLASSAGSFSSAHSASPPPWVAQIAIPPKPSAGLPSPSLFSPGTVNLSVPLLHLEVGCPSRSVAGIFHDLTGERTVRGGCIFRFLYFASPLGFCQ